MVRMESSDEFLDENEDIDDISILFEDLGDIEDFLVGIEDDTLWNVPDIPIEEHVGNLLEILDTGIVDSNDNIELKLAVSMFVKNFEKVTEVYDLRQAIKELNQIVDVFDYDESEVKRIKLHDMINNGNRDRFKLMMFAFMLLFVSSIKQQELISSILGNDVEDEIYILEDEEIFILNIENKIEYLLNAPVSSKNEFIRNLLGCSKSTVPRLKKIRSEPYSMRNLEMYSDRLTDIVGDIKKNGYDFNMNSDRKDDKLDNKFKKKLKEYSDNGFEFEDIGISEILLDVINVNVSFLPNNLKRKLISNINRELRYIE